jgi:hypothetical protein
VRSDHDLRSEPCIRFKCEFVDEKMKPFVMAPSKATDTRLREIADSVKETVAEIESSGILDFSFLESGPNANPWNSALREHLMERIGSPKEVLALVTNAVLEDIQNGRLLAALGKMEQTEETAYHHGWYSWRNPVFVRVVMSRYANEMPPSMTAEHFKAVAKIVYKEATQKRWHLHPKATAHGLKFPDVCNMALNSFREVLPNVEAFIQYVQEQARVMHPSNYIHHFARWLESDPSFRSSEDPRFVVVYRRQETMMWRFEKRTFETLFDSLQRHLQRNDSALPFLVLL